MRKIANIPGGVTGLAGLLLLFLMGSCSADEFMTPEPDGPVPERITAVFRLTIPGPSGMTRADIYEDEDKYKAGDEYEGYISTEEGDYRFLFFDLNNIYLETLQVEKVVPVTTSGPDKVYLVEGSVSKGLYSKARVNVVGLANWGDYNFRCVAGETTIKDICAQEATVFSYTDGKGLHGKVPSTADRIPMYGVSGDQLMNGQADASGKVQMKPVQMLRAYAKIVVKADFSEFPEAERGACSLKEVTMSRVLDAGFKAPENVVHPVQYVHSEWEKDYTPIHLPASGEVLENVPFMPLRDADGNEVKDTYVIYVPEYRNVYMAEGNKPAMRNEASRINIRYSIPAGEETAELDFKYYNSRSENIPADTPFDVCRNVWYTYNVKVYPWKVDCTVDLQPYSGVDLNPNFGLERDRDGNIIVRDDRGIIIKVIPSDGSIAEVDEVEIGNMRYVEVFFHDVIKFREFYDKDNKINGRQDFLANQKNGEATDWNLYDKEGVMTACFITYDSTCDGKSSYSTFDSYSTLRERWEGGEDADDHLGIKPDTGIKVLWTVDDPQNADLYKIFHKDYENGTSAIQTMLRVFDEKGKLLTVVLEEGETILRKEHAEIMGQFSVEVYEGDILKYRFLNDGQRQNLFYDSATGKYDWDYYEIDGYRYSGFDHSHPGYDNKNVFSRYDRWGNLIERSINATQDEAINLDPKHGDMIIKWREEVSSGNIIIMHLQKNSDGSWGTVWKDMYLIKPDGEKTVLV